MERMTLRCQGYNQGNPWNTTSALRNIYSSLVEPPLHGDEDEKEEEEYTDIQGDLAGHQSELSRNPR